MGSSVGLMTALLKGRRCDIPLAIVLVVMDIVIALCATCYAGMAQQRGLYWATVLWRMWGSGNRIDFWQCMCI